MDKQVSSYVATGYWTSDMYAPFTFYTHVANISCCPLEEALAMYIHPLWLILAN